MNRAHFRRSHVGHNVMVFFPDFPERKQLISDEIISRSQTISVEVVLQNAVDGFLGLGAHSLEVGKEEIVEIVTREFAELKVIFRIFQDSQVTLDVELTDE